jgi:ferredoxin
MKIKVDKDKCISCGLCVNMCPDYFEFDENNKSKVTKQPKTEQEKKTLKKVIESCPVGAISEE